MTLANIHVINDNVGDARSAPRLYFGIDAQPVHLHAGLRWDGPAIFGGGGQFTFGWLREVVAATRGARIAWGIGANANGRTVARLPSWMDAFDLIGVRDWDCGYRWVPCASCMHPVFDAPPPPTREAVFFKNVHSTKALPEHGLPTLQNNVASMCEAVAWLASAEVVVTDSYHGAYWATLLGRRVVALPFSSKFFAMRHPPAICLDGDWRRALEQAQIWPGALADCRAANSLFAEDVARFLQEPSTALLRRRAVPQKGGSCCG